MKHTLTITACGLLLASVCAGSNGKLATEQPDVGLNLRLQSAFAGEQDLADQPVFRPALRTLPVVTLAVTGPLDPDHAPLPANDAEQLVFNQCYRTLTYLDGSGAVRPSLAMRWQSFNDHRRWELTLDPEARFWDGAPVTAQTVLASWLATAYRTTASPSPPNPLRWLQPGSDGAKADGTRTIVITLGEPMPDLPAQLAHPALAVRRAAPAGSPWPLGSGPCRPVPTADGLDLVPAFPGATAWDTLRVLEGPVGDRQADLVLTRDEPRPTGMVETILPWDRMYLLICPPTRFGATENERRRWTTDLNPQAWAEQATAGQGRPASDWSFLTDSRRLCPYLRLEVPSWSWPDFNWPGRTASRDRDLVLYPDTDPVAKGLADILAEHAGRPLRPAEDLVGRGPLTAPRRPAGGFKPQALGPSPADFEAALQAGRAGAYILPVKRQWGSGCRQLAGVLGRANWLQDILDDASVADQPLPAGARALNPVDFADPTQAEQAALRLERARVLTPLIVTRGELWSRPGLAGLTLDFQGNLDLTQVGRR